MLVVASRGPYLEEVPCRSGRDGAVLDVRLFGKVLGGLDRRLHAFGGQERSQVCRV